MHILYSNSFSVSIDIYSQTNVLDYGLRSLKTSLYICFDAIVVVVVGGGGGGWV